MFVPTKTVMTPRMRVCAGVSNVCAGVSNDAHRQRTSCIRIQTDNGKRFVNHVSNHIFDRLSKHSGIGKLEMKQQKTFKLGYKFLNASIYKRKYRPQHHGMYQHTH